MNYAEARARLPEMERINLMNFNDVRLTEAGELGVLSRFSENIFVELGEDLLEVSKLSVPKPNSNPNIEDTHNLYIIRNLRVESGTAITLDDGYVDAGPVSIAGVKEYIVYQRKIVMVGTAPDATPELQLSDSVSPHHMHIRLGNMAGNIHFADRDSERGTVVYLDKADSRLISWPRREFAPITTEDGQPQYLIDGDLDFDFNNPNFLTVEGENGRWTR